MYRNAVIAVLVSVAIAILPNTASAALVRVDFTIDYATASSKDAGGTSPFGVPALATDPVFTGYFVFDLDLAMAGSEPSPGFRSNNFADVVVDLVFQTGSRIWGLSDLDGSASGNDLLLFNGSLQAWSFPTLNIASYLFLSSNNTFSLSEDGAGFTYCNNCVSFETSPAEVPLPAAFWLFGVAIAAPFSRRLWLKKREQF